MKKSKRPYVMTARAERSEATRARIRMAAMQLYREHTIEDFTLDEVAARAGTTVQTVLRMFGSKDDLILAALDEMASGGVPLRPTPPGDVAAAVAVIIDLSETLGDLLIQRLNDEQRRPALKPGLDLGRENHRDWVKVAFAPQLAQRRGSARTRLHNALIAATDVYVWKVLRRDRALTRPAAEAVVREMVVSLVTWEEKADGSDSVAELVGRREPAA